MTGVRNAAVVLAGGAGLRMAADRPKQLIELSGRSVLERAVAAFDECDAIDRIVVMASADTLRAAQDIVAGADFSKVTDVAVGGATRRATTLAALRLLDDDILNVLVHDAARPLVSQGLITSCVEALTRHEAVVPVLPSSDTVYQVVDHRVDLVLPRAALRRAQTPQAFRLDLLRRAHELAETDGHREATDDCGLVRHYLPDVEVRLVDGEEANIKVTTPSDLALAAVLVAGPNR